MRFHHNLKVFRGQFDSAPFAAVFFVLLIFLLLHSSLVFVPGVPIRLPEAGPLPGIENPTVVVAVDKDGQFYFEHQACAEETLKQKLAACVAAADDPLTLVVQADQEVKYQFLLRLAALAHTAGVKQALLATREAVKPVERSATP